MTNNAILDHWNQQAAVYGQDEQATMPDTYLRALEIQHLAAYITSRDRVLDVGCGNGFGTICLARATDNEVIGIDFAPKMIDQANDRLASCEPTVRRRVHFMIGNVLQIPTALGMFDKITSARCLINLRNHQEQDQALRQIHERLLTCGQAVLSEDTMEGLAKLNSLRHLVKLPDVAIRWHNHYLSVGDLMGRLASLFRLVAVDEFSSMYYIMSRVVNARLAADRGEEPRYDSTINRVAAELPSLGDYGLLKIIVLERL
jgi:SAM-dependent methyltransferase